MSNSCDVFVAGGGVAGIAAALGAARTGAKTILVEKECVLGGLGTLGLVTIYLPLCDGEGNQVIYGIGEELLRLSIRYGAQARYPVPWLDGGSKEERRACRFQVQYNPHIFAILAEQLLLDAGVEILYDTRITKTEINNGRLTAVQAAHKGGETVFLPKTVVDCTGDADLCAMAGEETVLHENGNPLAGWYYSAGKDGVELHMLGCADIPGMEVEGLSNRRFSGLDGKENSEFLIASHQKLLAHVLKAREVDPSLEPVTIPTIPQFRMTRRLAGLYTLDEREVHHFFPDSTGLTGDWRKRGPVFEIPFGCLHGKRVRNLLAAGRCISVTDDMWDITRVIPTCAVTGEAAGRAAALAARMEDVPDLSALPLEALQEALRANGVLLHERV